MLLNHVLPMLTILAQATAPQTALVASGADVRTARIDVTHSTLGFSVRHFGVTKIRGVFNEWSGTVLWNEADITKSSVAVVVHTASIDTRHERRDGDLTSDNFFDSEQYPAIVLKSTRIERDGEQYVMHADLTVRDVTREVAIPFEFLGVQEMRGTRLFVAGSFEIKRSDFGLDRENRIARALGAVSDKVEFELDIQAVVSDWANARYNSRRRPSIGELMANTVESEGVVAAVEQYRMLKSSEPEAYNFSPREPLVLGYKLNAAGKHEAASQLAGHMLQEAPTADWHVLLATISDARGDAPKARAHLERALELDQYNTVAILLLQRFAEEAE